MLKTFSVSALVAVASATKAEPVLFVSDRLQSNHAYHTETSGYMTSYLDDMEKFFNPDGSGQFDRDYLTALDTCLSKFDDTTMQQS